jgi:hypothetical protein
MQVELATLQLLLASRRRDALGSRIDPRNMIIMVLYAYEHRGVKTFT